MKAVLKENEISYAIRGAIFKVYNELGPGLLESVYEAALCYELRRSGLEVKNPGWYSSNLQWRKS